MTIQCIVILSAAAVLIMILLVAYFDWRKLERNAKVCDGCGQQKHFTLVVHKYYRACSVDCWDIIKDQLSGY